MLHPRWKKVVSDLLGNPVRTLLVVLSIFIGVFAVGLITSSQAIITRELSRGYLGANPADATISVSDDDRFGDDLLQSIENMRTVEKAEGRRSYGVQALVAGTFKDMQLVAIDDFDEVEIDRFERLSGKWPPGDKEMLVERSGLAELGLNVGDSVLLERADGKQRRITIVGTVYAPTEPPATFGSSLGYINFDTMEWISGARQFNQLAILVAGDRMDEEYNAQVAQEVYEKVQKSGRDPSFPQVATPGEHPLSTFIGGMVAIMSMLGVLSVFLSGFLVTNTISALLAQQVRQIGIMKAVGARSSQIIGMYLVLVLGFGMLAMLLAYPLIQLATRGFSTLVGQVFNFTIVDFGVPFYAIAIQVIISLLVPVIAAIYPVISGTNITIREALSTEGGAGNYGRNIIDRAIQSVRGLPRPVLLSLRNTFRRKGRVTLTLLTLTLGGAIFIAIFSVRASLISTVDSILDSLFNYDVQVAMEREYRDEYLISEAKRVPGVIDAEAWRVGAVREVLEGDREGETITLWGVPYDSQMIQPTVIRGRWLLPNDENAIVLSNGVFADDSSLDLGDEIVLRVRGRDVTWRVVGEVTTIGEARWGYTSYDFYGRIARDVGAAGQIQVATERSDRAFQEAVATALDEHFTSLGINVSGTQLMADIRQRNETFFNVIIVGLLVMSVLIAVVGGLGLAGTMSLNVLERIREIGIMRAIGASDWMVLQVVMAEGLTLGLLSWFFGTILSLPIGRLLSDQVGIQLFSFPLTYSFSIEGAGLWLAISLALASVASFLPAWRAARVTVRDVLAYE